MIYFHSLLRITLDRVLVGTINMPGRPEFTPRKRSLRTNYGNPDNLIHHFFINLINLNPGSTLLQWFVRNSNSSFPIPIEAPSLKDAIFSWKERRHRWDSAMSRRTSSLRKSCCDVSVIWAKRLNSLWIKSLPFWLIFRQLNFFLTTLVEFYPNRQHCAQTLSTVIHLSKCFLFSHFSCYHNPKNHVKIKERNRKSDITVIKSINDDYFFFNTITFLF